MNASGAALCAMVALSAMSGPAWSQPARSGESVADSPPEPAKTKFKCQSGGDLTARFASRNDLFVAIVDAGDGPHALPVQPFQGGGPIRLTWSDGTRTLTWSPGVQIMWMDGASHRMCGRGEHKH